MADVLVLGAGVAGLTAAVVLQEHGHRVSVWTRDDPAATTSAVAAAIWLPYLAEPRQRVLRWSRATYARLAGLAGDAASGVRLVTVREVFREATPAPWWLEAAPRAQRAPAHELPPGYGSGLDLEVPFCDTRVHLPWLLQRIVAGGGRVERRTARSLDEALGIADRVVNCTGLGARELCGDTELRPIRGQVLRVRGLRLPRAIVDETGDQPCYLLPRGDDTVLGGTAQSGDERTGADEADTNAILARCRQHAPEVDAATVAAVATGLRPWRSSVRLERQACAGGRWVVHDYGHGGSGFTLAFGCAEDVARLVAETT